MATSILFVTFVVGLALVVVAILGGGIEIKEVKIPSLPIIPRTASFIAGCVLLALTIFFPQIFPQGATDAKSSTDTRPPAVFLGGAIRDGLITVRDVKRILIHLGKYTGPIDDEPTVSYKQAVAEFQLSQNIPGDTLVGPETYKKLREAWPEFFALKK